MQLIERRLKRLSAPCFGALLVLLCSSTLYAITVNEQKFIDEIDSTFRLFNARWDGTNGWFIDYIPNPVSRSAAITASSTRAGSSPLYAIDINDDLKKSMYPEQTAWEGASGVNHWELTLDLGEAKRCVHGIAAITFSYSALWTFTLQASNDGVNWGDIVQEHFRGISNSRHISLVRFMKSEGHQKRYWRLLIDTSAAPNSGAAPSVWDFAIYEGYERPLTMPTANYAMAVAVKHKYGLATAEEIARAQKICENFVNYFENEDRIPTTWDYAYWIYHPLFTSTILEAMAVCYQYLPLDSTVKNRLRSASVVWFNGSYILGGWTEKLLWAPIAGYWAWKVTNNAYYRDKFTYAYQLLFSMFNAGTASHFTGDFKYRYYDAPDEQSAANWGLQEYWTDLYPFSFYNEVVNSGGTPFSVDELAKYRAWQQAVVGNYALNGIENLDSEFLTRGHSCQYVEWAGKSFIGWITSPGLNQFNEDQLTGRWLFDKYLEQRHIMDTWDGDELDGALPVVPLGNRTTGYELLGDYSNFSKLTAAGIFLSNISLALLQGAPDKPSKEETGLARWFWKRKHLLINTDTYSSAMNGTRRVNNGPSFVNYVGVHPSRIMDKYYRPLINYLGSTPFRDQPGFELRLQSPASGDPVATTRHDYPTSHDLIYSPWDLSGIGDYDTRPLNPRFDMIISDGVTQANGYHNRARVHYYRRAIRDERTITPTGTPLPLADAYIPFILNKGMTSKAKLMNGDLLTICDIVNPHGSVNDITTIKYLHNTYNDDYLGLPSTGIVVMPLHDEMAGYIGEGTTLAVDKWSNNLDHFGEKATQYQSRNIIRFNLLTNDPVPSEIRWRAIYAFTDGTDAMAEAAYNFYMSNKWRSSFNEIGMPQIPGIERVHVSGWRFGGKLQNEADKVHFDWEITATSGSYADVLYKANRLEISADTPTQLTLTKRGLGENALWMISEIPSDPSKPTKVKLVKSNSEGVLTCQVKATPLSSVVIKKIR